MKAAAATIGMLFTALFWTGANAAVISNDSIADTNPSAYDPFDLTIDHDSNIEAWGIGRGPGITAKPTIDRYNAISWTIASDLDNNDYYYFKLDANDGYKINFESFVYDSYTSGTGPAKFAFRSSLDGYSTNIETAKGNGITTINLSDDKYKNLTETIEFRLYGYSAGGGSGSFGINEYTFNGTVEAVPEPGTLALVGVGSLLMLASRHRTRKSSEMAA